ncbi:pyruvate, phosphate dikinase regulatory protein, chloroplastic isoform X1 [Sorghum bicolor]|nr:pyruvate, phosphate dikinase regulatory protein, chloroplastic isoform X1 [Sorghum bicolor]|eukprot:XP_021308977.1 pyruvate, phosphate dikinase regulatory protein, chloroplastic isoform X1 [Sorghum bicolor]
MALVSHVSRGHLTKPPPRPRPIINISAVLKATRNRFLCNHCHPSSSSSTHATRVNSDRWTRHRPQLSSMIGSAKPLAAPLQPPSPTARCLAPSSCAPDSPPPLTRAVKSPAAQSQSQSQSDAAPAPPPPRPAEAAASSHVLRASPQLSRWSRARALRSGRRPGSESSDRAKLSSASVLPATKSPRPEDAAVAVEDGGDDDVCVAERDAAPGKAIYIVSDGTGWTAEHAVNAALGQFEHCFVDRGCAVNTHLISMINDMDRILEVIKQAAKEGALVLYTLADPSMAESAKKACDFWGVPSTDVLRPTIEAIASHIGVAPSGIPRSSPSRQGKLTEDYFRRIDAIDFTIKQDDGALPQNLNRADIVLAGVSRTGKTPLSIYLAQKGYKVANVPIVMGVNLPKTLFEISQDKIFGLTVNPVVLQAIRKTRAKALGFGDGYQSHYAEMEHVRQELLHANQIFAQNPTWPVIGITGKAIEETAAVIVRIYHDRKQKCSMPRISKRVAPVLVYNFMSVG